MFSVDEIAKACRATLIQGDLRLKVAGIGTDSRKLNPKEAFLTLKGANFDAHDFIQESLKSGASALIIDRVPDIVIPPDVAVIKVKDTTLALGDLARYRRQKFSLPVIAVTGSNGKTTAKEMIAWVLSSCGQVLKNEGTKNNQIGLPQTLLKLSPNDDFAVVEIGTNHFGEVDYLAKIARPNIGLITNIGLSHLEFLNNLRGVLKEKSALLDNLREPAIAVLNADDKLLKHWITKSNNKRVIFSYGISEKSDFSAKDITIANAKLEFKVNHKFNFILNSLGVCNVYNALAAISVGRILGLSYSEIAQKLADFKFPKGRLNLISLKGTNFIDDTYNSNPLSFQAALSVLRAVKCKGKKVLVMGDMLELGKQKELLHRQIGRSITNTCDLLLTVGNLSRIAAQEAGKRGFKDKNIFCFDNSQQAREFLFSKMSLGPNDFTLVKGSRSMRMEEIFNI
ncbi:MAG: UDP-N-acetylmuramoyl-tripeptide--D-alanyl-D-alanine ligase [Candidatus Omnitrophica bacterium]|nr:UDP-N-acetylmuramoyl-tripeptide--D-alanyl-D-alanine ligase [Candidatus Omnitrophota bacterium]